MVFSGRPSSACHACRTKRLKCDRVPTGCSQCTRKRIPCPGYWNPCELRLRDETDRVARKAQGKQQPNSMPLAAPSASPAGSSKQPDPSVMAMARAPSIERFPQATDELALAYFMSSYIVSTQFEGYLPELYSKETRPVEALVSAVYAASFATFAMRVRDTKYLDIGRKKYALALTRTNELLANPKTAVHDTTLASVLLLGLFEAIVFQGQKSPENWTAHTLGAAGLLRLRGLQQFEANKIAKHLFAQVANNIRTSCVQRKVPVPAEFIELNKSAMPFLDPLDPAVRLGPILDKAASLRARDSSIGDPKLMLDALDLDEEVVNMIDGLEYGMLYVRRSEEDTPPWAFLGMASRYPSRRVAKFWNATRMIRMFLNEVIWAGAEIAAEPLQDRPHLEPEGEECEACECSYLRSIQEAAADNMTDIAAEVLSSVPDFIESPGGRFYPCARTLIWPLRIIQKCLICPPEAVEYAHEVLQRLGQDLNVAEAVDMAKISKPKRREDWLHLYHLG